MIRTFIMRFMQTYELLAVFPGTAPETDVGVLAEKLKGVVAESGGAGIAMHDLGKSRLAYPMKHIRYGYFRLCHFSAEPKMVPQIQAKALLTGQLLRAVVRVRDPKKSAVMPAQIMSDAAIAAEAEEIKKTAPAIDHAAAEVAAFQTISVPKAPVEARATETAPLPDIEKKLDELLASDLSNV